MRRISNYSFSVLIVLLSLFVLNCSGQEEKKVVGFDLNNLDTTVSPADNFYEYAVGTWAKNNPVPGIYSRWSVLERMYDDNAGIVRNIIEEASKAKDATPGSIKQKVGDFYATGMDSAKIEQLGIAPLKEELDLISSIASYDDVIKHAAHMHTNVGAPLFNFGSILDAKRSGWVIIGMKQGGLGLPDRDYYVADDSRSKEIRVKYLEHLEKMFELMGENKDAAAASAKAIMNIETQLAKNSRTQVEQRDPEKNYNKMQIDELQKTAPNFNWKLFFTEAGISEPKDIDVGQPEFFAGLSKMINKISIDDWKTYFRWNLISNMANYLNDAFVKQNFEFNGKFMSGTKEMQPRWKRIVAATNLALGEAVGQLYVEKYFPPQAKERAKKIVDNLLVSMGERIDAVDWMSDETKAKAREKLSAFTVKIGYPDKWIDYTKFEVDKESYAKNRMRSLRFNAMKDLAKIDKPADRTEWLLNPQDINAYYLPYLNEIAFPAAILQFPFFDPNVDDAINYGAMGGVIGHEITHGFDNRGRQFDAQGNLKDWWAKEDNDKFLERTKKIIEQYNEFEPIDSFFINGELTQGENIADLGGLTVAYNAFKKTEQFKTGEKIDGFTPQQRFFLSWAEVWKGNIKDERLKLDLKTDVHSPGYFRCNGPLSNMSEFWEAFNVQPGDPMRRPGDKLVKIW